MLAEGIACKTPVIGAISGAPKALFLLMSESWFPEPSEATNLATVPDGVETVAKTLNEAITHALKEDWEATRYVRQRSAGQFCMPIARCISRLATRMRHFVFVSFKFSAVAADDSIFQCHAQASGASYIFDGQCHMYGWTFRMRMKRWIMHDGFQKSTCDATGSCGLP